MKPEFELIPCPFCKKTDRYLMDCLSVVSAWPQDDSEWWHGTIYVYCRSCKARGPGFYVTTQSINRHLDYAGQNGYPDMKKEEVATARQNAVDGWNKGGTS